MTTSVAVPDARALITDLQQRLEAYASPETKAWWEDYLKGAAEFRGVPMGRVRDAVTAWHIAHRLHTLDPAAELDLALALLREPVTEDRLAGILHLQEILLPAGRLTARALPAFAELFDRGHIADWNTCDWFCVKVLGPLIRTEGEACARQVAAWKDAGNLWRRRAAAVAFVNLAPRGDDNFPGFTDLVLEVCEAAVGHQERFAQTGTAWTLRELSVAAPDRVAAFVRQHRAVMSAEAVESATRKLPDDVAGGVR